MFDEVTLFKKFIETKLTLWKKEKTDVETKWQEIFNYFESTNKPLKNLYKVVEFVMVLPGTNGTTERAFTLVNDLWTDEKNQFKVETIKAILSVKMNLPKSCEDFQKILVSKPELLKKIHSSEKYKRKKENTENLY